MHKLDKPMTKPQNILLIMIRLFKFTSDIISRILLIEKRTTKKKMGRMRGLEPPTPGITSRCSNQLSYIRHIA